MITWRTTSLNAAARFALGIVVCSCHGNSGARRGHGDGSPTGVAGDTAAGEDARAVGEAGPDDGAATGLPGSTTWSACGTLTPPRRPGDDDDVLNLAASSGGRYLAASAYDITWVFALPDLRLIREIAPAEAHKPEFSRRGSLLALGGDARHLYRLEDGARLLALSGDSCWRSLTVSPDDMRLASGGCGTVEIYGIDGGLQATLGSQSWWAGVAFSPDGRWLGTSGPELWTADGGRRVWPSEVPTATDPGGLPHPFNDAVVVFSPDGRLLLASTARIVDRTIPPRFETTAKLMRIADGSLARDFGSTLARRPSFSPDSDWIAAGGEVLHLTSGATVRLDPTPAVSTFLPDGRIAGVDADGRLVRFYCPTTGPARQSSPSSL